MWFTSAAQKKERENQKVLVKCYCRVMHCLTWGDDLSLMPLACDGQAIGQAQLQLKSLGGEDY